MATVIVNKRQYDNADCKLTVFGAEEDEFKDASYSYERDHTYNKSAGGISSYSVGGIKDMKCSITLYMTAVQRIKKIAKANGVTDITLLAPFDMAFNYVNEELDEVTDIITGKFQSDGKEVNGEGGLAMKYDLFVTGIQLDV